MLDKLSSLFSKKDRVLGVSRETRRYDLPLSGNASNTFLRILICLMTVLGMFALASSFALSAMTSRWSDGLENKISVEIPAADSGGEIISPSMVKEMTQQAATLLNGMDYVLQATVMADDEIRQLLSPWLGEDMVMDSVPIPGLISVTLESGVTPDLENLQAELREVAPRARIDTHENWLADVIRFTGALQFAAAILSIIIGLTTLVAVAGAVRSKMSENKEELELLHLMGASDSYIARQLQRHTLILSFQGGLGGVVLGAILLSMIGLVAGRMGINLIPDFHLTHIQQAMLAFMPLPIALLAMLTARFTVLRVLAKMP